MPPRPTRSRRPRVSVENALRTAISRKLIIRFCYSNLERECEPHVLGMANGRLQVLCWQLSGGSRGGNPSPWRRFDVSDITAFRFTRETFPGPRPVPFPHSSWDEVILSV